MKPFLFATTLCMTVLLMGLSACKSTNIEKTKKLQDGDIQIVVEDLVINKTLEVDMNLLDYQLKGIEVNGKILKAKVAYSGGCKMPHDFELITNGAIKDGIMDVWLLHHTQDDYCKKMIIEYKYFDIHKITKLKSRKLKGYRVNEGQIFMTIQK